MATTKFIWDVLSNNVLMETTANDVVTQTYQNRPEKFGELLSTKRGVTNRFYHFDVEHSTRKLTGDTQNITDTYIYSAFGEEVARTGVTTNPFGYKGAVGYYTNSSTNDIYVRARTYQPTSGRWLSKDPLGFVDGSNLYRAYFVPNGNDPSGNTCIRCKCRGHAGNLSATGDVWIEKDCAGNATSCCEQACDDLDSTHNNDGFTGQWEICTGMSDEPEGPEVAIEVCCGIVTIIDVLNCPSGESVPINFGIRSCLKKAACGASKALSKKELECEAIHKGYRCLKCKACVETMTAVELDAQIACFSAHVAGRLLYLHKKCDYVLKGSICFGSKGKESGHKQQFAEKSAALANCVTIRAKK